MKSAFKVLFENYTNKYTMGGFLPGDFVKFKSNILSDSRIKSGNSEYLDKIKELMNCDCKMRIQGLTSNTATKSAGSQGTADSYYATIYKTLPGNSTTSTDDVITVPLDVLELVARSAEESQMEVPSSFKKNVETTLTAIKQDDSYDKGKGSVKESNDSRMKDNLSFYVMDNTSGEFVVQRNLHPQEHADIDKLFKKWAKGEGLKVVGTDPTNSGGEYYARISDTPDGVRVWDSCSYFTEAEEY